MSTYKSRLDVEGFDWTTGKIYHQSKIYSDTSEEPILSEVELITNMEDPRLDFEMWSDLGREVDDLYYQDYYFSEDSKFFYYTQYVSQEYSENYFKIVKLAKQPNLDNLEDLVIY